MGRLRSLRRLLGRMQRDASGIAIPQTDGSIKRFTERDIGEAYCVTVRRECGEDAPLHPANVAAANSADPEWRSSLLVAPEELPEPPPDLSEP